MKILVCGSGVIGSLLIHTLLQNNNEVTVLARGKRREELEKYGLRTKFHGKKIVNTDRPRVVGEILAEHFDLTFSVMQHEQQWKLLKTLGAADCSAVVLVGNNLSAPEMKQQIIEAGGKNVLFGFQGTGGNRYEDYTEVLSLHAPSMVLGGLGEIIPGEITSIVESTFAGADYEIKWMDDMDAWYKCHAAFIVPVARLCYTVGCDLRKSTGKQRKMLFDATSNAFEALKKSGCAVRPEGEDAYYRPGAKRVLMSAMMNIMCHTKLGDMAASDHCRHAVSEMEGLAVKMDEIVFNSGVECSAYQSMKDSAPSWEELHRIYDK